ncbi:MAG: alpha/beta hydrolase [Desulfobacteraceae bacterium]|nr:alpha/beta hydrolase [Desulfobacteraceae bacterium]
MPTKWAVLIGLVVLFLTSFYFFYPRVENFFVFFPDSSLDLTPEALHLTYKDVYIDSGDGKRLHGWFFPQKADSPVILFFHGNAGNISHRLHNIGLLLEKGLQVFIFDYRGYGKSGGRPSEKGIYMDGLAAYDYLVEKEHFPPDKIILFGRSLGAAVAIEVALSRDVKGIIIESGFTSTKGMARSMILFNAFSYFLPANYNNLEKIGRIRVPKLIIHGDEDHLVPFAMGEKLFSASKEPKYFYALRGAGHNDTYVVGGAEYLSRIANFVRDSKI